MVSEKRFTRLLELHTTLERNFLIVTIYQNHTHTHARTHAHTHARTHARTHTRTHAHTHTQRHTHTHTHTHTHQRFIVSKRRKMR